MKYVIALPLAVSLAAAQMSVMGVASAVSNGPMTHTVVVGGLKPAETGMAAVLGYTPESIIANQGDMVVFKFMQKNHTVTQSTFEEPCKKKEGGLDSGFMPNPDGTADVQFNMTINTTEPLWFYCKQKTGTHCGKGMVFSINPATTGDKTMTAFKQLAINKNGTDLKLGAIQSVDPNAAAAPTTVTVQAGTETGTSALATATVIAGQGTDSQGNACSCSCLCGVNSFPVNAAVNNFGGFAGMIA